MVQPERPNPCPLVCELAAAVTWRCAHVSPPSVEVAMIRGCGSFACGNDELPRKSAKHTYACPKNGLEEALSAQICSLSSNVVLLMCAETKTGVNQFAFT